MKQRILTTATLGLIALGLGSSALVAPAEAAPSSGPVTASAPAASAAPAKSATHRPRAVRVWGQQIPVNAPTQYRMAGRLIGDWTITPVGDPLFTNAAGSLYAESGREVFDGCLNLNKNTSWEPQGRLTFAYLYWASFDASGRLIKGQCVHPVTGGNGDFTGARGLLTMYDRPVGDEVRTRYEGEIVLDAVAEPPVASASVSPGSAQRGAAVTSANGRVGC